MTMLKRTLTGLSLIGILLICLYLGSFDYGYVVFDAMILLFISIATVEMFCVMKNKYKPMIAPVLFAIVAVYPMTFFFNFSGLFIVLVVAFLIAMVCFVFSLEKREFEDLTSTLFILIYPFAIGSLTYATNARFGIIPIMLAIGAPLMSDAFAYFAGSIIGGKKIFPNISPKKTYAGCIAGLFGGIVGALAVYALFEVAGFPSNVIFNFADKFYTNGAVIIWYSSIGLLCAVAGEIGDLAASSIKRYFGIKDYSTLLGTHGGMMDRIDSILFAELIVLPTMLLFFA